MEYISSDTNIWIDFDKINRIELPFLLPYTYIMYEEAISSEILEPKDLQQRLQQHGLVSVDISDEEFFMADDFGGKYKKLSVYDRIALAIAKVRKITLVTGDGALRKAGVVEGVAVVGTIGILDKLFEGDYIKKSEYQKCLLSLQKLNGTVIRLPADELEERIGKMKGE